MAFLKTKRSQGRRDVLINLDHVKELLPISTEDRRTRVVFTEVDDDGKNKTVVTTANFDVLVADHGLAERDDEGFILPNP